jgi:hypothetical protein
MRNAVAVTTLALAASAGALCTPACAQSMDDKWQFQAIIYAYLPDIGGKTSFPDRGGAGSINVNVDQILSNLNFTFMGTFEARKGRWGMFTDLIYLDVSGSKSNSRDFTIGGRDIPASLNGNLDLGIKATIWTIAGQYTAVSDPTMVFNVLAGARLLDLKETLSYGFNFDVGPFAGPARSGNSDASLSYWDAIVGAKGRYNFGGNREWFIPYYADVGTGQSQLTWQVFGGLGYQFSWGSVLAGWRYMDYKFKSSNIDSVNLNGPMIGAAFTW